jgi:chromosome segregation ATPase
MWSNVFKNRFDTTSTVDFHVTDLREENSELRRQIATLYSQLLLSDSDPNTANMSAATSTKSSRHASREFNNSYSKIAISEEYKNPVAIAEETISTLERELESHKAYIKEQANVAKELEQKCQQKDEELLKLSLEVVQGIPLKARIKELKKTLEDQNQTFCQLRSECATLHTQLQELQDEVHKKDSFILQQENVVASLTEKLVSTDLEFQGKFEL